MCLANIWYDVPYHLFRPRNLICSFRCMNREQTVYVRTVFSERHPLTSTVFQGADADDFNPDRFIDADGQVTPALADTKDGASSFGEKFIYS